MMNVFHVSARDISRSRVYMVRVLRKRVFRDMRTVKAKIRQRIRAVWSGPSLFANRIIGYYRMYEWW